jgi:hypothetical protein
MVNQVGGTPPVGGTQRTQSVVQANALRSPGTLTAVQQVQEKPGSVQGAIKVFSVPQAKSGQPTSSKLPRGSLVDVLA